MIDISREACARAARALHRLSAPFGTDCTEGLMITALRAALDRAETDLADLKHDLARYMAIAGEEATRAERAEAVKAAAGRDAVEFIYKHGDLTYSAANAAIRLLTQNGFQIVRNGGKP